MLSVGDPRVFYLLIVDFEKTNYKISRDLLILLMVQKSDGHQLRPGEYPMFHRVSKIKGGAEFLPSTVCLCWFQIPSILDFIINAAFPPWLRTTEKG